MQVTTTSNSLTDEISRVLTAFARWLNGYGESSWDYQSFYAGPMGGRAKSLYYRSRLVGTAAVAPMVFCEAFVPSWRRLFHRRMRFPIADAHYAMGFAFLYQATSNMVYLERAMHFLRMLKQTRCSQFKEYCWGYPFDWVTRNGVIERQTPLITSTPYAYEAFLQVLQILRNSSELNSLSSACCPPSSGLRPLDLLDDYKQIVESIARHASADIKDFKTSATASSSSYTPFDKGRVINAAAYRAFLLTSASQVFSNDNYWKMAERNLNFVIENQNADGSWPYAVDGVRDFVDHFHTCFVMKALAKIHALTGHQACKEALAKAVSYYLNNLFDVDGLPKPFSKAPRLTVYKRELYDCAECINLCLLLRDRFPQLEPPLEVVVKAILRDWIKADGSFRSRRLYWGWDNVPMHRWGQSQMFRALAFYLAEARKMRGERDQASDVRDQKAALAS
ncbi:MAG TPA: hypothetical protein VFQ43_02220 [Nitrososphaera sp.]|nr:hypothetical protein [Nitrososphaera sp.]